MPKGFKHGWSYRLEYNSWLNAVSRCHRESHPRYKEWGGAGITVCDEWRHNFKAFIDYIGERPTCNHSLDRIDGSRGYEPGNVRWATKSEQSMNRPGFVRQIPYQGETLCLSELARRVGMDREKLKYRLDRGWDIERAIRQ